jgi:ABC-type multidrug transport system fused ATPase/permease subunit
MKPVERGTYIFNNLSQKQTMKSVNLKKLYTPSYNRTILRQASTLKIDPEKAAYDSELLWENENISSEEELFPRRKINLFKFYFHLFEPIDWVFFIIGMIGCLATGASKPLIYYLNSQIYSDVGNTSEQGGGDSDKDIMMANVEASLTSGIKKQLIYGAIALADNFIAYFFIGLLGTRCLYTFKRRYFSAIFAQEQAWFDSTNIFEFASKIQAQLEFIETGMGDVFVDLVVKFCICIGCLIFSFFGSWKLALVVLCLQPFMIIGGIINAKLITKAGDLSRKVFEQAGAIAEEILYNIKIINSFANFDYELKRFYEKTEITANLEKKRILISDIALSFLYFGQVLSVFIAILYGRTLVANDYNYNMGRDVSGGDINLTFNCAVTLIASTVDFLNDIGDVTSSLSASSDYFNLIERRPQMDLTYSIQKPPLSEIQGNIEFNNVDFYYPSDPDKKMILKKINLKFLSGKKTALIGESGSGKTTVVNLIERIYERTGGEILIDGIDIKKYDIQYLRNLIGYCEQEPILFNRSIRDNIIFGREKYLQELGEDIDQLIQKACEDAYVNEFINNLPGGLDYIVYKR